MKRPPPDFGLKVSACTPLLALLALLALGCRDAAPPPPTAPRAAPPAPSPEVIEHPLALSPGTALQAEIPGGGIHRYRFALAAGQFVDLAVEQWGIDLTVRLLPPDGPPWPEVDSPNGTLGPEPLPVLAGTAGMYRLEVRSSNTQDPAGEYAVLVRAVRPGARRDRDRVEAERSFAAGEELRRRRDGRSLRAAVEQDRRAAAFFRRAGERGREADVLYALGRIHHGLGEPEEALRAFEAALPVFRALGERRKVGRTLNSLGPPHLARGDPEAALACYREALAIVRPLGDRRSEATALHNSGRVHASLGEIDEALDRYGEALALWRELALPGEEGMTLADRASLFAFLGETERALEDFGRALPRLATAGQRRDEASVLAQQGFLLARSGRPGEGLAGLRRALRLQREAGNRRGEETARNDLALVLQGLGRQEEARRAFEEALAGLGEIGDSANEAAVRLNLGRLQTGQGDLAAATQGFAAALRWFDAAGNRAGQAAAKLGLASADRRRGNLHRALESGEEALSRIESLRTEPQSPELRATFFSSHQEIFAFVIDLRMELHRREPRAGHAAAALETSERARARSLLDTLAEAGIDLRRENGPGPAARPLRLAEIREEVLDGETLLLEYALGERQSFLWVVDGEEAQPFELPGRAVLEGAARKAHALLAAGPRTLARGRAEVALAELSRLVLGPVRGRLGSRRLLVVPDGALHLVPFAALPLAEGSRELLVDRHEVVVLPSASTLALLRRRTAGRRPPPGVVAVLADPVFGPEDPRLRPAPATAAQRTAKGRPARLPFSQEEARAILALAPPGERLEALGFAASRETVIGGALSRFRIVHFATHGVVSAEHPWRSGIVLSLVDRKGRPQEGFLRTQDIYSLDLPADLVVLSGCETALGREVRGEGLVGLTQAFFHAGARRILVSLWPVEDRATAEFMRRFYRGLFAGLPPTAALRQAQRSLRREPAWQSPSSWAGFVLQGDWRGELH